MSFKDSALAPLRAARQRAYGVHDWDDLLEHWIRSPWLLRPSLRRLRRQIPHVARERQVLFIHVPKNGGTSVASALYGEMVGHQTAYFYQRADPDFFARSKPFATLRDPIERFISAYWFVRQGGGSDVKLGEWFAKSCKGIVTVDDLLTHVERSARDIYSIDHVLRPQTWYLCDRQGRLLVERLFLLGRDDAALATFLKSYGVSQIPTLNTTLKRELTLTETQRERILAIYADDVSLIDKVLPAICERHLSPA